MSPGFPSAFPQGTLEQIKANRELKRRKELLKDRKRRVGEWGLGPGTTGVCPHELNHLKWWI